MNYNEVAYKALSHWNLRPARVTLIAERENRVFKVVDSKGKIYALRVHRLHYQSEAAILSELAWMKSLEFSGILVPEPIIAKNGKLLINECGFQIDLLSWLKGKPIGVTGGSLDLSNRLETFFDLGRLLATLHNHSDSWELPPDFVRPKWDKDGILGPKPVWGKFWENPSLNIREKNLFEEGRNKALKILSSQDFDFGLIHADMVRENILIDGSSLAIIDFDDCGFGYRLFDLATALIKNRSELDYQDLQAAILNGYKTLRIIDVEQLDLFLLLRAFTYVGWIVPRIKEPEAKIRQKRFIKTSMALCEKFLSTGCPSA